RFGVLEIAVLARLITIVVKTRFVRVDDRLPLAVKTRGLSCICIGNHTDLLCLRGERKCEQKNENERAHKLGSSPSRLQVSNIACRSVHLDYHSLTWPLTAPQERLRSGANYVAL